MTFTVPDVNLLGALPLVIVAGWAMVVLLIDLRVPRGRKHITGLWTLVGILAALVATVYPTQWGKQGMALGGMMALDLFGSQINLVVLLVAFLTVLFSIYYLPKAGIDRGEFYPLMLFSVCGMMMMGSAADLIVVFLALELLSIPLYILSGIARPRLDSEESALKYFLLGAFASAFLIYGIALVYGATGTTSLAGVYAAIQRSNLLQSPLLLTGTGLVLVGLFFKVAAVPFHMWTPDVYEGAPTAVTSFMSVGAKAGGFAALFRILVDAFPALYSSWSAVIILIAILTVILGNVVAIAQNNLKRMLAYSSIAHAGYILMALAVAQGTNAALASQAALYYLLAYAFTNLGAFAVVMAVEHEREEGGLTFDDYSGLWNTKPGLAIAMAIFMLSLTGVPPTAGFTGKLYIFRAVLEQAHALNNSLSTWLVVMLVVGVITSVFSAFYYLRVVVVMFMREGRASAILRPALTLVLILTVLGTLVLGIYPSPWFTQVTSTAAALVTLH